MATDIFPEIDIPVISIIWNYGGLPAPGDGAADRGAERAQPDDDGERHRAHRVDLALRHHHHQGLLPADARTSRRRSRQVVAIEQTQLRQLPPGMTPPLIIKYSASSIPVVQLGLSSPTLPEQTVFDAAVNTLRPQLVTIPGVAIPFPYGGKNRLISVDLDMQAAAGARPVAGRRGQRGQPAEPDPAVGHGQVRRGTEYTVRMNGSPDAIAGLNDLPVRTQRRHHHLPAATSPTCATASQPQTNIVRQDGARGVLLLGAEERRRVHARHRRQPEARCCRGCRRSLPADVKLHAAVRPVGVRQGGGAGRGLRGAARRRADRGDGAAASSATGARR